MVTQGHSPARTQRAGVSCAGSQRRPRTARSRPERAARTADLLAKSGFRAEIGDSKPPRGKGGSQAPVKDRNCTRGGSSTLQTGPGRGDCAPHKNHTSKPWTHCFRRGLSREGGSLTFILTRGCFFTDSRGRGRERERNTDVREKHQGLVASCTCPDWELNTRPFGVWDDALTTEPTTQGCR